MEGACPSPATENPLTGQWAEGGGTMGVSSTRQESLECRGVQLGNPPYQSFPPTCQENLAGGSPTPPTAWPPRPAAARPGGRRRGEDVKF